MRDNTIRTHVYSIPELVESYAEKMWNRVCEALPEERLTKIENIVITGCGYSYASAIQAKYIFETIAKIPAEAVFSIDASRHLKLFSNNTLVIGVSNSGIVARVAETLERFRTAGMTAVAFTGDLKSRCAQKAEYTVDISCPVMEQGLPIRGYVMALMGYYAVAWRIALAKGVSGEHKREQFFEELSHMAERLSQSLEHIEKQTDLFAEKTVNCKAHEFVGSGMEYASAWLGRQQIIGQSGRCGMECSLEDWLHSNFFWNEPERIGTMLFAPSNTKALSRAIEVQHYMLYLKRPVCVITDSEELVEKSAGQIILPQVKDYVLNPILEMVPVSLYAGKITRLIGEEYSRGFRGQWNFSKNGYATEFSEVQIIE